MKTRVASLFSAVLAIVLTTPAVEAVAKDTCHLRVAVELTPDVPNPSDQGFLDSLIADPVFQLTWVSSSDSGIVVDLSGPGPASRCRSAMKQISTNTHVLNVAVVHTR
jgi:hypothetical protein